MGYRSDVAYTIRFNGTANELLEDVEKSFKLFLAEAKVKPECAIAMNEVSIDEKAMHINFYCDSVKWYDSFPDVDSHIKLVSLAREWVDDGNTHIGVVFCRIGEELEDMHLEQDGNSDWDWISLSRSIELDWTPAS